MTIIKAKKAYSKALKYIQEGNHVMASSLAFLGQRYAMKSRSKYAKEIESKCHRIAVKYGMVSLRSLSLYTRSERLAGKCFAYESQYLFSNRK